MYKFFGVLRDIEKEKKERKGIEERKLKDRSSSPHESWFEMNYPMGSWNS
jgi:hypothetical protein